MKKSFKKNIKVLFIQTLAFVLFIPLAGEASANNTNIPKIPQNITTTPSEIPCEKVQDLTIDLFLLKDKEYGCGYSFNDGILSFDQKSSNITYIISSIFPTMNKISITEEAEPTLLFRGLYIVEPRTGNITQEPAIAISEKAQLTILLDNSFNNSITSNGTGIHISEQANLNISEYNTSDIGFGLLNINSNTESAIDAALGNINIDEGAKILASAINHPAITTSTDSNLGLAGIISFQIIGDKSSITNDSNIIVSQEDTILNKFSLPRLFDSTTNIVYTTEHLNTSVTMDIANSDNNIRLVNFETGQENFISSNSFTPTRAIILPEGDDLDLGILELVSEPKNSRLNIGNGIILELDYNKSNIDLEIIDTPRINWMFSESGKHSISIYSEEKKLLFRIDSGTTDLGNINARREFYEFIPFPTEGQFIVFEFESPISQIFVEDENSQDRDNLTLKEDTQIYITQISNENRVITGDFVETISMFGAWMETNLIPDPILQAAINSQINIDNSNNSEHVLRPDSANIITTDLQSLSELHIHDSNVSSLNGLENAKNLRVLQFHSGHEILEISTKFASRLTSLEQLIMPDGKLESLPTNFDDLSGLTWVNFDNNYISDISMIRSLRPWVFVNNQTIVVAENYPFSFGWWGINSNVPDIVVGFNGRRITNSSSLTPYNDPNIQNCFFNISFDIRAARCILFDTSEMPKTFKYNFHIEGSHTIRGTFVHTTGRAG